MSEPKQKRGFTVTLPDNLTTYWFPLAGAVLMVFTAYSNLATKPELIKVQEDSRAFAIAQDLLVTKDVKEYSDRNHNDMLLRFEQNRSEWKADVKGLATTQQFTLDGLRRIEDRFKELEPKRKH